MASICVFAQEKSTWLTPLTSGTIRSSSTSVALGLSNWISTRCRTGNVISLIRAIAAEGAATIDAAVGDYRQFRSRRRELVRFYVTLIGLIFIAMLRNVSFFILTPSWQSKTE